MKKFISLSLAMFFITVNVAACSGSLASETTAAADSSAAETTAAGETTESTPSTAAETTEDATDNLGDTTVDVASFDDDNTLTVGFDQEFPPMGFIGDDGEYTGFDLEVAAEVASRLGMDFVAQPINWDAKDMELESGNIDCIWNGFTMQGREDEYTWSDPYMDNSIVFVVNSDSGISTFDGLAGKIVEVQLDSSGQAALEEDDELSATFGELLTTPDYNTAYMDLEQGAVDAICIDIVVGRYQITERGADMTILDETLTSETYGVGFRLGNTALRDQVNNTLYEMADDGTLAEISTRWFGEDITTIGK